MFITSTSEESNFSTNREAAFAFPAISSNGANVTGTFTGEYTETIIVTTGADGIEIITTSESVRKPSYEFCVDDVNHSNLTYDSNGNVETCKSK